jgi:hypothetical protein
MVRSTDDINQGTHSDGLNELVVDSCSMRKEEATSRTQSIKEEQILVFTNLSVVSLGSHFSELLVLLHLLGIRERDTIDTVEHRVVSISFPV